MERTPSVVIIGAGIAGLAAATSLTKTCKFDVLVLEGSDHIGGRINTQKIGDKIIENGANWIHGTVNNPIFDLAKENGISLNHRGYLSQGAVLKTRKREYKSLNGKTCAAYLVREIESLYGRLIDEASNKKTVQKFLKRSGKKKATVGEFLKHGFENHLREVSEIDSSEEIALKKCIFQRCKKHECIVSGCSSLDELHLEDFGEYCELDGGHAIIPDGYDQIINVISNQLDQDSIYLNHKVSQIKWLAKVKKGSHDVHEKEPVVQLSCENGKIFLADHVIVTLPLGVLKATHSKLFVPQLPKSKKTAIDNLGFGTVNKVFLEFEKPFWDSKSYDICFLWQNEDIKKSSYPSWIHRLHFFGTLHENSNILMGWISGGPAMEMEGVSVDEIQENCGKLIQAFAGLDTIPRIISCHRTCWHSNPLSRGSYSFISKDSSAADIDILCAPVPSEVEDVSGVAPLQLLFAGEASHRCFYSTVHGAFLSGIREAERLIGHYKGSPTNM